MCRIGGFLILALAAGTVVSAAPDVEGSFERTLNASGAVDLDVRTGSGSITVRPGDSSAVRVIGRIRAGTRHLSESEARDKVRRLETNPPIEQNGNAIRIGHIQDRDLQRDVSISYEITTPAETRLRSNTGSGNQELEGVRGPVEAATGSGNLAISRIGDQVTATAGSGNIALNEVSGRAHATTGSGDIRATGVAGGFRASTGSGGVRLAQTAPGDVEINTGSGNIEATGVRGGLRLHSGSGSMTVDGEPAGPWNLEAASGNIRLRLPAQAAFDLAARTSSGRISINHPLTLRGVVNPRRMEGKVRGGGMMLALSTASGNIRIE